MIPDQPKLTTATMSAKWVQFSASWENVDLLARAKWWGSSAYLLRVSLSPSACRA